MSDLQEAIKKKYGEGIDIDFDKEWTNEDEKKFSKNNKKLDEKIKKAVGRRKEIQKRVCDSCGSYSFKSKDDIYMARFDCCYECYIRNIEGR